jgi:hypothetical protein
MADRHSNFLGTYFNKETVLKLVQALKILAWVILAIYAVQLVLSIGVDILQILRGFWAGMSFTDGAQNFLGVFEQPLQGMVYAFALLGISQLLLIFLDIEDNTRRAAREREENNLTQRAQRFTKEN